jgi:UDP-N-acetylmuramoyl-L-alanyl-D-glutamate--2,6-diaminopimelate ligase
VTPSVSLDTGVDLGAVLAGFATVPHRTVRDLTLDSRNVRRGDAFVAISGNTTHGITHVADALSRGAVAVLWDPTDGVRLGDLPTGVESIPLVGLRAGLGEFADRFYGEPSTALTIAGITGTNGKTTCAWLYSLCHGDAGGYMGTLGLGRTSALAPTTHTTLDVISIHRALRDLVRGGVRHVGMEISSHALHQDRVSGVRLPLTAFTNLTRDHLDYHGSMDAYRDAKGRLFSARGVEHAVINVDDSAGRALAGQLPPGVALTRVALSAAAQHDAGRFVAAGDLRCTAAGIEIDGSSHAGAFRLRSSLIGAFNAENLLVVLGLLLAAGMPLAAAVEALEAADAPPGRMERFVIGASGPTLVVDYAHTPDALAKALNALRAHTKGSLWCVFGCGGDRDAGKRALMASAAEAAADRLVLTDDNPRTEDPDAIIAAMFVGLSGRVPCRIERNREAAIRFAASEAAPGDVVLIAGKGHEDYQIYGADRLAYSDRSIARSLSGVAH